MKYYRLRIRNHFERKFQEESQSKFNNYYVDKDFDYYLFRAKDEIFEYLLKLYLLLFFIRLSLKVFNINDITLCFYLTINFIVISIFYESLFVFKSRFDNKLTTH